MLLLTVCSPTPNYQRFVNSVKKFNIPHKEKILDKYPGNNGRYKYISTKYIREDERIMFTDTEDVIFQTDIPEMEGIVVAPENEIHSNSYWKDKCIGKFSVLLDKQIYNAGCYSMIGKDFINLVKFISSNEGNDQLLFNLWLLNHEFTPRLDIFCPLYANYDKGIVEKEDELWKYKGKIIFCVHENGLKGRL
jgi:hypothetical protein